MHPGSSRGVFRRQSRIAPEIAKNDPRCASLTAQFTKELTECADPRPTVEAIPMRMVL